MAVPANSTRTSVAHQTSDTSPATLPEIYSIVVLGDKMLPKIMGGTRQTFSTVIEPKKGDIIALWFAPWLMGNRFVAVQLVDDLPAGVRLGDTSMARTPEDTMIYVETLSPRQRFAFRASEIAAIHKWIGSGAVMGVTGDEPVRSVRPAKEAAPARNELSIFKNEKFSVRGGVDEAGEPWFVANDVTAALGYKRPNDAVNAHCKGAVKRRPLQTPGGIQEIRIIHEPDVYRLIFRSELETAQEFEDWVVSEVLPSIRKTGGYSVQPQQEQAPQFPIPQTFAEALMLAANQAAQIEHQKVRIEEKNAQIEEMAPKAEFHDDVASAVNAQEFLEACKVFGTGRGRFVAWLKKRKFIMENRLPYQQYLDAGYFRVVESKRKKKGTNEKFTYTKTLVTGKGIAYLHRKWVEDHKGEPA